MSPTTITQFTILVEFMEKHGDLSKPQYMPNGRQWTNKKWQELAELLNSQGIGETCTEEKWRKVWSDLKNNSKRKWAKNNRGVQGTGGGPAQNIYLTDLEQRVLAIIGVQAAVGMAIPEVGVDVSETKNPAKPTNPKGDEGWNMPSHSRDEGHVPSPIPRVLPAPTASSGSVTSLIFPTIQATPPSPSIILSHPSLPSQTFLPSPQPPPLPPQKKNENRKRKANISDYFLECETNAREDARDRERMYLELERERIRQRDIELRQRDTELQLQAQWMEIMKAALKVLEKFLNEKK